MKVTDEAAVLLRIGAFGLAAALAYGLLAYEWLGTLALLTLGLGPLVAGLVLAVHAPGDARGERAVTLVRRLAGFPPRDPAGRAEDLEAEDLMIIPSPSVWPFLLSLGLAVALTGLVFGLWLLLLGGLLTVWSLSGWVAAVNRETRLGRLRPTPPRHEAGVEHEAGAEAEPERAGTGATASATDSADSADSPEEAAAARQGSGQERSGQERSGEAASSSEQAAGSERSAGAEPGRDRGRAGEHRKQRG